MTRLVLFDIDGTLVATGGAGVKAFAAVARSAFGQPDGVARLNFAGRTDRSIVREFLVGCGVTPSEANIDRFLDDYLFWLDHFLGRLSGRVLPGVGKALEELRRLEQPPLVGLLTGNVRLGAELKLRRFGLWEEFTIGAFGDDHEDRNVLAAIARDRGAEWLGRGLTGEEILVIGDTPLDIACARAIGARCLAVATGGVPLETLREHAPTWAVASLEEVAMADACE
jgi:phosphoglycolate phosphatase